MLEPILTPSNITFVFGILAIIFSVFNYFKNPQIKLEKKQAIDNKEEESRAKIFSRELELMKQESDRRFGEMGVRMDRALTLAENHTHTVDTKVDNLTKESNDWHLKISNEMTELSTIIKERIPNKNV